MSQLSSQLDQITNRITANFREKYEARDRALKNGRDVIRHSANAIRAVHRNDVATAQSLLEQARELLEETDRALAAHADIYHAGFVHDAQKEYAEARITLALVANEPLPDPESLGVGYAAYLNGAGEAVGELRREVLDQLRHGRPEHCEALLGAMDDIYSALVTIDFPDAMTGGLRRTTDSTRGILERTRGDLTMALVQRSLEQRLSGLEDKIEDKEDQMEGPGASEPPVR